MKKFNKLISIFLVTLLMVVLFAGCVKDEVTKEVNVYNWGDYIDESIFEDFEKETGIHVNYDIFDTNENMYTKIKSGGTDYDVAIPSDYMIEKMIKEDMLEKIDLNNVSNFNNIKDNFKNLAFDPNNQYSIPYMWGTFGIIYNSKMVDETVDSWNILWDEKYKDQILMFNSLRDTIAISLKRLGYSMNSTNPQEINKAKEELIKQKPLVRAYVVDEVKDMMVQEEAALAVVWSGDAMTMIEQNPDLKYVVPKEGSNMWFDNMVIIKDASHKAEAEKFINFMNRPDIAQKNAEYIGYSTPNKEAFNLLDEEIKNDKTVYPQEEVLKKCEVFVDLGEDIKLYDEAWTEIMAN